MCIRKLLLHLIKKMSVFFFAVTLGNVYGMDRAIVAQDQSINRKALQEFLRTSFFETHQSYVNLSDEAKEKRRKKIIDPNDKIGAMLFDIATKLPPEIQNLIALKLLNNNNNMANKFLNMSVVNALYCYSWSQKVFSGEIKLFCREKFSNFHKWCTKSSNWKGDVIFEQAQDIIAFEAQDDFYHNRKTLKSIYKFCNKFGDPSGCWRPCVRYKFYESYTLSNFKQHQDIEQWLLLPMVIATFWSGPILQNLERTYDYQLFTAGIAVSFAPYSTGVMMIKLLPIQNSLLNSILLSFLSIAIVIVPMILYGQYFQHSIESSLLRTGCAIGAYAVICSIFNVIKMRSWQDGEVMVWDIPKELQRNDIQMS